MAEVIRNIFKVYVDSDWKVTNTIPAPIAAFGNGQTTIRIVSEEADPAEYTGGLNFILASGETLPERQYMTSNSVEIVNGQPWFIWDFDLTRTITANSSKNADGTLYFTSVFKVILEPDNENPQVPQSAATISASSQTVTEILEDDVVQQISGDLNDRLLKDSTGLTDVDNDNVNLIPFYDSTSQLQTKQTKVDFIQDVIDEIGDTTGVIAYPTDGLAGITSPLTGNPVTRTVDDINDEDFDQDNPVIVPYIILATGVWEIAFESVYPIGFLTGEYQSLVFTQNLFAKKTGDNIEARTSYYIYDAINGLRIIGSGPGTFEGAVITASTDDYSAHSKQNVINALSVDPGIGERVYTVTEVRGTAGDTATAQLEDSVSTFSTWQLPTGGALAGLIRKIPSPVEDNLVSQNADGSLKDGAIAIGDVMQKSVELPLLQLRSEKNQANGYAGIEADGFISNAILPQSLKRWLGTFGTAGSDTGGDLPTVAVSVGDTYECIIDAYNSVVAGEIFDNGDFATYNGTGWSKTDNTEAVKSVNGKTGIITIVSTDIPDMPSSLVGQGRKIFKVSEDELTYELARENNNSSTGIEIADNSIPSLNVDVTKYNLTAGTIKFIDLSFDPAKTHIIPVSAETGLSITGIATRKRTYLAYQLLDATLKTYQIVSLSGAPTTLEYRNLVPFAIAFHPDGVNISRIDPLGWVSVQHSKNAMDMSGSYLSSNKQGNDFIPNGVNLNLDVSLGKMACLGCNRVVAPSDPNNVDNPASTNEGFILVYRDGLGDLTFDTNGGSLFTTIDPTWFDDGTGVIGTNPGNANSAVMNRIYRSPRSNTSYILVGQTSYATIGDAISARVAGTDNVQNIPTYLDEDLVFRTYFSVRKNATNLSLITDAELFNVLGESGVTAGGVVTTLNDTAVTVTGSVGDLPAQVNVKEAQEMFEYKHIAFSQILQFVIEDEITTAKAKVNNNVILKPFQKYDIQLPTFVSANPIELSLDDGTTHAPLVDENLVAIIGTTGVDAKLDVFWNGASLVKYVNQDLEELKRLVSEAQASEIKTGLVNHILVTPQENSQPQYKDIKGLTLNNLIIDGDFPTTTNWTGVNATLSVLSKILSFTATGSGTFPRAVSTAWGISNAEKYFLYAKMKANALGQNFSVNIYDGGGFKESVGNILVDGLWQEVYGISSAITTVSDTNIAVVNNHAVITSEVTEVDGNAGVFAINMTTLGIESFTEAQMLDLVRNGYFEGIVSTSKDLAVKTEGTNLESGLIVGDIDISGNITTGGKGLLSKDYAQVKLGETYTTKFQSGSVALSCDNILLAYYDKDKNFIERISIATSLNEQTFVSAHNGFVKQYAFQAKTDDTDITQEELLAIDNQLNKGSAILLDLQGNVKPYITATTTFNFLDDLRSVGSVEDIASNGIVTRKIDLDINVGIGATINTTSIPTISLTSDFIAIDNTNGEVEFGTYGDTLTLTNASTVYFELATYLTEEYIESGDTVAQLNGQITLEGTTVLPQEYTAEIATTHKDMLDQAIIEIRELNDEVTLLRNNQGDLTLLNTTDKSSIVNAINEIFALLP